MNRHPPLPKYPHAEFGTTASGIGKACDGPKGQTFALRRLQCELLHLSVTGLFHYAEGMILSEHETVLYI